MALPLIAAGAALGAARAASQLARSAEAASVAVGNMAAALKNAAAAANVSVRSFYSLQASLKAASVSASGLTSALSTINKQMITAQNRALPFNVTLKRIGVDMRAIQGAGADEAFKRIGEAIRNIKSPLEQQLVAMEIFGEKGAEMLEAFRSENFGKVPAALQTSANLLNQNAAIFASISAKLEIAGQQVSGFFTGLRSASAPGLESLLKAFNTIDFTAIGLKIGEILKSFATEPQKLGQILADSFQYALRSAGNQLYAFFEIGRTGLPKFGELLFDAFETSFFKTRASILELQGFLKASLLFAISEARNFFTGDFIKSALTTLKSVGEYVLKVFTDTLPKALKSAFEFLKGVFQDPAKAWDRLVRARDDVAAKGMEFIAPAMQGRKTFGQFLDETRDAQGIAEARAKADEAMKRGAQTLLSVITGGMKDVFGAGQFKDRMQAALKTYTDAAEQVAAAAKAQADSVSIGAQAENAQTRQLAERRSLLGGFLNSYAQRRAERIEQRRIDRIQRGFGISEKDIRENRMPGAGLRGPGELRPDGTRGPSAEQMKRELREIKDRNEFRKSFGKPLIPLPSQKKEPKGMMASSTVALDKPTVDAIAQAVKVAVNELVVA